VTYAYLYYTIYAMDKQIIYYYRRGVASYLIAKKFGVSNNYVRSLLEKNGVKLRGHNVTNKVSAQKRTPEENRAITRNAARRNLGTSHSRLHRSRLAISREKSPTIDPVYEKPLVDLCKRLGMPIVPQKAFSKFNVDLYLSKENVVIEIFGGNFHNKPEAVEMFDNKLKYLSRKKIPVLVVWADKLTYSPENVLMIAINMKKPLEVISGDGTPTTRGVKLIFGVDTFAV
jgi:very-short-patch-repair endonuclease/DNA-binding CsgD family transcriptional regulator